MATKGQKETDKDRHRQPAITLRLPEEYDAMLRKMASANDRTLTAEVMVSLREYWKSLKLWPQKK